VVTGGRRKWCRSSSQFRVFLILIFIKECGRFSLAEIYSLLRIFSPRFFFACDAADLLRKVFSRLFLESGVDSSGAPRINRVATLFPALPCLCLLEKAASVFLSRSLLLLVAVCPGAGGGRRI